MRGIFIFAMAALLGACGREDGQRWNASLPWSQQEYHVANAERFASAVAETTGGKLTISVFPNAVLGLKGPETIRALEEGLVDMAEMPSFQEAGAEPILGLESLPYLVETQAELKLLHALARPAIEAAFARHGLKVLYIVPWPPQNIYTKHPFATLEDVKGVKIRTYDRNTTELMTRLGLTPIQMQSQDVVPALASGVIDAVMTSTTTGAAQRYWEFLPYMTRTNHVWISNVMAVSGKSWAALDADTQTAVERLARAMEREFWQVAAKDDLAKQDVLVGNGMKVMAIGEELLNDMRARAVPMWAAWRARVDPETAAVLDAFLKETGKDQRQ